MIIIKNPTFAGLNKTDSLSSVRPAAVSQKIAAAANVLNLSLEGSQEAGDSRNGARRCSGGSVQAAPAG